MKVKYHQIHQNYSKVSKAPAIVISQFPKKRKVRDCFGGAF